MPSSPQPTNQPEPVSHNQPEPIPDRTSPPSTDQHIKPARKPLLRLEARDLSTLGVQSFLSLVNAAAVLEDAVHHTLDLLYTAHTPIPPTRSITLVLRSMDGVAYTTGSDLDNDHKEIHLSTDYVAAIPSAHRANEIRGVLVHEMVHCWQWNAGGTAPGGLIEGIADWVRLKAGYAPGHWKRVWKDCKWDDGYEKTGYFLDFLESEVGEGTVRKINGSLQEGRYHEERFWKDCCGHSVGKLWEKYGECMKKESKLADEA
ncbi:BSP-domain-containing protein [Microthyrium microscopicum]|uniref:BSP-domain-containing protein n=1 Tax=Microthyrium microscopicum TaxID=703497 RepID=A0A6A6UAP1_9PEZI|nr:BSP-domain-containing protein [Microthyrium microscopicum]